MDNSELNPPITNIPPASSTQPAADATTAPPAPAVPNTPIIPSTSGPESKKPILILVIGAILALVLVGGIFLYLNSQQTASKLQTTLPTPPPTPQEDLGEELNRIDVESTDSSEFDALDQDLEQL